MKKLDYSTYLDKVLACWTGKSIGGIIGAPYECHKQFKTVDPENLWPKVLYPNDDLDIQVVYLEALQELGVFIDSAALAKYWKEHCFYICCEYGIFINNYDMGILPPYSGTFNNDWYHEGMGCPIRAEIWGIICAGNPKLAVEYAAIDGCLDHDGLSVEVEKFLAAACSMAFFENDLEKLLDSALEFVAPDSKVREIYAGVKEICSTEGDLHSKWTAVIRRWGHRNATATVTNFPLTLMALFLSKGDFKKAMHVCMQSGWDADCTAASAGALLGLLHGTKILPEEYCEKMGKTLVCACEIPHQFASLESFADDTARIGVEMSLLRNKELQFVNAPEVTPRPQQLPPAAITVDYPCSPVLYTRKETAVVISLHNNTDKEISGILTVAAPASAVLKQDKFNVSAKAGEIVKVEISAKAAENIDFLPQKNIFTAKFDCSCGKTVSAEFGLFGATQYNVYGPYWDMWDKTKYDICPYDCEELTCNPGNIPGLRDAMDMYVEFDKEYLDEETLKKSDIPAEKPIKFEKAGNFLYNQDWSDFYGTGCFYLTTTIRSAEDLNKVNLNIGCNVPVKAWLDGQEIFSQKNHLCRTGCATLARGLKLDNTPKRLVIKLTARTENIQLSWSFSRSPESRTVAISQYLSSLETKAE